MTAIEKVGLLDSNDTLLVSDYDYSAFELRLTNNTWGVLFEDVDIKTEFDLNWTSGDVTISAWNAIIVATRATSTPIANKKIAVRYQLSDTKTLTGTGTKIYIELDQTLIDDPTLIEDTYPSIDYAQGKNIGELKRADERPTTNPHIKLWEYDWAWNDLRTYPEIDGKKIDSNVVKLTGDQTVKGVKTFTSNPIVPKATKSNEAPNLWQVETAIVEATGATDLTDSTFMLWEPCTKWDSLFKEVWPTFAEATTAQNIGDVAGNTRVSIPVIWSGVAGNSIKLALAKVGSPSSDLIVRIETDNAGSPSGELVDANATATITAESLTTSLANTTISMWLWKNDNEHSVVLDNTEISQTIYKWIKIQLTSQTGIVSVEKDSQCTATKCYIYDDDMNLLTEEDFVWDEATFNYNKIEKDWECYLFIGSDWASYTNAKQTGSSSFPYNWVSLDFVWWFKFKNWEVYLNEFSWHEPWTSQTKTEQLWYKIKANKHCYLRNVTKVAWSTATRCILKDSWWNVISTVNFSWNVATFSAIPLFQKQEYFVVVDNNWDSYTSKRTSLLTYPMIKTNITYLSDQWWRTWEHYNLTAIETASAIYEEENNINSITNITTNENILLWEWQKAHLVLAQTNDTVNGSNYFRVGTTTNHTTTRPMRLWNTTRWAEQNTKFAYTSSDLFTDSLLSLTDATYPYKLLTDILRFAKTDWVIGEKVKCSFKGIADWFEGLDMFRPYFLQDTPWTIWLVKWTNEYMVWYPLTEEKLKLWFQEYLYAWTDTSLVELNQERADNQTTYIKKKSATIYNIGSIIESMRISVVQNKPNFNFSYVKIVVNGVDIQERYLEHWNGPRTRTVDMFLKTWDVVEARIKATSTTNSVSLKDFSIKYSTKSSQTIAPPTAINTQD